MTNRYRLYRRANGIFYWEDTESPKQGSLRTKNRAEAERLLHAKNEATRQPGLNLNLARAYLAAHDPAMITRTWQAVMDEMARHGIQSTQDRAKRMFASKAFDSIRNLVIVQTTPDDILKIAHGSGHSAVHYLRRLHNLAIDIGWLAWPILTKRAWPKVRAARRRAITSDEHARIIASEKNTEKRLYYELLYETGASQSDAAELMADNIDWCRQLLVYRRKKLGPDSEPARLTIGARLRGILVQLPEKGSLFPTIKTAGANARATEFARRCRIAKVTGVSLHSYRHAWAQRAKACGYPQRFAQDALGHASKAIHEYYGKGAVVIAPSLEDYERASEGKIIDLPGMIEPGFTERMSEGACR